MTSNKPTQPGRKKPGVMATSKEDAVSRHEAILLFNEARSRLMHVNEWHTLCGEESAMFRLADDTGRLLETGVAEVGHLIRIAPGGQDEAYEWVRIEKFEHEKNLLKDEESFGFVVKHVQNPDGSAGETNFSSAHSTSTFTILRTANTVIAMELEENDTEDPDGVSWLNKVRTAFLSFGAMMGLGATQWKCLVNGLLKGPDIRWQKKII